MEWKGKYKSEIMMVCHMDAKAMYEVGAISDKEMREFDEMCLVQEPEGSYAAPRTAAEISAKRLSSQEL
jgi:DNA-binding transcriptional regulator YiaG